MVIQNRSIENIYMLSIIIDKPWGGRLAVHIETGKPEVNGREAGNMGMLYWILTAVVSFVAGIPAG